MTMTCNIVQVKLSGKRDASKAEPTMCWAGGNTLAVLTGELTVRCWDLQTSDTYLLAPPESAMGHMATPQEVFTSLSYCKQTGKVLP